MSIGAHYLLFSPEPLLATLARQDLLISDDLFGRNSAENANLNSDHLKILKLSRRYFHLQTHWHLCLDRPSLPAPPRHNYDPRCGHSKLPSRQAMPNDSLHLAPQSVHLVFVFATSQTRVLDPLASRLNYSKVCLHLIRLEAFSCDWTCWVALHPKWKQGQSWLKNLPRVWNDHCFTTKQAQKA